MSNNDKNMDDVRTRLARFMPDAIAQALNSYYGFLTAPDEGGENDEKGCAAARFSAQQKALKASVAHIEHLLKIVKWIEENEKGEGADQNLKAVTAGMVEQAVSEVQDYKNSAAAKDDKI